MLVDTGAVEGQKVYYKFLRCAYRVDCRVLVQRCASARLHSVLLCLLPLLHAHLSLPLASSSRLLLLLQS